MDDVFYRLFLIMCTHSPMIVFACSSVNCTLNRMHVCRPTHYILRGIMHCRDYFNSMLKIMNYRPQSTTCIK